MADHAKSRILFCFSLMTRVFILSHSGALCWEKSESLRKTSELSRKTVKISPVPPAPPCPRSERSQGDVKITNQTPVQWGIGKWRLQSRSPGSPGLPGPVEIPGSSAMYCWSTTQLYRVLEGTLSCPAPGERDTTSRHEYRRWNFWVIFLMFRAQRV